MLAGVRFVLGVALAASIVDAVSITSSVRERLLRLSEAIVPYEAVEPRSSQTSPCANSTWDIREIDINEDGIVDDTEFIAWGMGQGSALVPTSHALPVPERRALQQHGRQSPFKSEAELQACESALYQMQTDPGGHLKIHIFMMSKCPYAARALRAIVPAMIQMQLFSYVTLRLDFIGHGTLDSLSGLRSMHGGDEVLGDKLYLCIQDMDLPIQQWMLLVICIASDYESVPYNTKNCLDMARVTPKQQTDIAECAQKPQGRGDQLLEKSFHVTSQKYGITESPTIFFTAEQTQDNNTVGVSEVDVLYCGDRSQADFISALCSLLGTLLRSENLRSDMISSAAGSVCPTTMQEPECTGEGLLSRFCATIREIRDFNREIYGTNRESVCIHRYWQNGRQCLVPGSSDVFHLLCRDVRMPQHVYTQPN
eukprot:SAG31_NODE_1790_length_7264_cov_3.356455_4_plen_425_part_00